MGRRATGSILTSAGGEGGESVVCIDYSSAADARDDDHHGRLPYSYADASANDDDCSFCSEVETDDDADEACGRPADDEVVGGTNREIGSSTEGEGGEGWNSDDASEYDGGSTSIQADEAESNLSTDDDETYYETTDDEFTDGEWDITFVLMRDGCFVERCLERGVGP